MPTSKTSPSNRPSNPRRPQPLVAALLGLSLIACEEYETSGDRADDEDRSCPAGEVCSPITPAGLRFGTDGFGGGGFDRTLYPVATGGEMNITIIDNAHNRPLVAPWFPDGEDNLEIRCQAANKLIVKGLRPGADLVRIFSAEDEALLDRVEVQVADLHSVELTFDGEPESSFSNLPDLPVALFADAGAQRIELTLRSAKSTRLYDQTLNVRALSGGTAQRDGSWDLFQISPDPAAAMFRLEIYAGGNFRPVDFPLARQLTRIDADRFWPELKIGASGSRLCFQAVADGHRVLAAPWTFTASPGITLEPFYINGCTSVSASATAALGPASVTAQVGTTTRTVELTVVAATAATAAVTAEHTIHESIEPDDKAEAVEQRTEGARARASAQVQ